MTIDEDRPVGRQHPRGLLLLLDEAHEVLRRPLVEPGIRAPRHRVAVLKERAAA